MNTSFIERGKLLVEHNMLQMDTLKPVSFSLPFDWDCSFDLGDMFLYRVQTFKFLLYLCDYHEDSGNIDALKLACNILENWLEHFSSTAPKGMTERFSSSLASNIYVWHDHATALRAENWLLFMEYCQENAPNFWAGKQKLKAQITKALARHGNILAEDAFYSARCNHGIEQARVLLRLAEEPSLTSWPEADQPSWRTIAIARLTDEFNTCFTSEGVHKENSPGYHVFVFKILLNILADPHLKAVHEILNTKFNLMARQALEYIVQIIQPNKRLPIIGDTEHLPVTDGFRAALGATEEYAHYLYAATAGQKGRMPAIVNKVYPESGWAIFRNSWSKKTYPDMLHLVCKAGCLVRYHHQLDEGQFVLFARGEHWFIDSGFFDYNRSSDIFKYIRSRNAHNVPNVFGAKLKDFDERVQSWRMDSWSETPGNAHVSMINSIYENVTLKRRINYPGGFNLTLTDNVECNDKTPRDVQFLFHIPRDKQITVEDNLIYIESPNNICTLKIQTLRQFTIQLLKGKTSAGIIRSQVSWQVKRCEDSFLLVISFKNIILLDVVFHISIDRKSNVLKTQSDSMATATSAREKPIQKNAVRESAVLPDTTTKNLLPDDITLQKFYPEIQYLQNVYLPINWHKTESENLIICFFPATSDQQKIAISKYIANSKESYLIIYPPQGDIPNEELHGIISYQILQEYWASCKSALSKYTKMLFLVINHPILPVCGLASQEGGRATVLSIDGEFDPLYTEKDIPLLQLILDKQEEHLLPQTMLTASGNFHFIHIQSKKSLSYRKSFLPWLQEENHNKFISEHLYINPQKFTFSITELQRIVNLFYLNKTAKIFPNCFSVKIFSTSSELQFYFDYRNTLTLFSLPVKWTMDPYRSPNWQHNLNKLEWLTSSLSPEDMVAVLINFHNFNQKYTNKFCHSSTGDHATTQRIYFILKFISIYKKKNNIRGLGICMRLIRLDIAALLNPKIYRSGCNHGLMADLALIHVHKELPDLLTEQQYKTVINRAMATFRKIFAENGISREHSVGYQLFDLPLGIRLLNVIEAIPHIKPPLTADTLLEKSKEFLGFFLTNDGTFFPLGDSVRLPDKALLATCFGEAGSPEKLLQPYSTMNGLRYWPQGYLVWRDLKKGIHMTFTCGRSSATHKHDDELSFCVRCGNTTIIDECGYTGFLKLTEMQQLSSAECHSTVLLEGKDWLSKAVIDNFSRMMPPTEDLHFRASHRRIEGFEISREITIIESKDIVKFAITDTISGDKIMATHRFILGPDIVPKEHTEGALLLSSGQQVARFILPDTCRWETQRVPYVGLSPDSILETTCIDVISDTPQLTLTLEIQLPSDKSSLSFKNEDKHSKHTFIEQKYMKENIKNIEISENEYFLKDRKLYAQIEKKLQSDFLKHVISEASIDTISLYRYSHEAFKKGDLQTAKRCERLNKILNHCVVPASCHIGQGTRLGYGGLGVLIHANTYIGEYCTIGTNATLASAPKLGDFIYVATGAKIIKNGASVGSFSIIGANAVVTHDVPPCSIVAGVPSRIVNKITPENIDRYLTSYLAAARKTEPDFMKSVREKFLLLYQKLNHIVSRD